MAKRSRHIISTLFTVVILAGILPISCMVHCALQDAHHEHAPNLYVCDFGHGIVTDSQHADIHTTGRVTAVLDANLPNILWFTLSLLIMSVALNQRTCLQWYPLPLVPPPRIPTLR